MRTAVPTEAPAAGGCTRHARGERGAGGGLLHLGATPTTRGIRMAVRGELDISTGPAFVDSVRETLADGPIDRLELVLSDLHFVDVAGFRSLERAAHLADSARAALLLVDPPNCLRRILDIVDARGRLRSAVV